MAPCRSSSEPAKRAVLALDELCIRADRQWIEARRPRGRPGVNQGWHRERWHSL